MWREYILSRGACIYIFQWPTLNFPLWCCWKWVVLFWILSYLGLYRDFEHSGFMLDTLVSFWFYVGPSCLCWTRLFHAVHFGFMLGTLVLCWTPLFHAGHLGFMLDTLVLCWKVSIHVGNTGFRLAFECRTLWRLWLYIVHSDFMMDSCWFYVGHFGFMLDTLVLC